MRCEISKYCIICLVFPILLCAFIIDKVLSNTYEQVLLDHIYFLLLWAIVVLFVRILSKTGSSFQTRFTFFSKTCQQLLDLCNGTSRIQTLEKSMIINFSIKKIIFHLFETSSSEYNKVFRLVFVFA